MRRRASSGGAVSPSSQRVGVRRETPVAKPIRVSDETWSRARFRSARWMTGGYRLIDGRALFARRPSRGCRAALRWRSSHGETTHGFVFGEWRRPFDAAAGWRAPNLSPETLNFIAVEWGNLSTTSPFPWDKIARNLWHEAEHQHGYVHCADVGDAAYMVGECMQTVIDHRLFLARGGGRLSARRQPRWNRRASARRLVSGGGWRLDGALGQRGDPGECARGHVFVP